MTVNSVSGFASIIGQRKPIGILAALFRKRSIPHAMLFYGIPGVGKKTTALEFAKACNCLSENPTAAPRHSGDPGAARGDDGKDPFEAIPCGECRSCRKIAAGNHPDVMRVRPSGAFIKIDQIRELYRTLTMKPYEARCRVVMVSDAHTMNVPAGNALLKLLEEPPDQTVFVLTAPQPSDLLPTIASRCQHLRFAPIPSDALAKHLVDRLNLSAGRARIIAEMANGSYALAHGMAGGNWFSLRNWILKEIAALPEKSAGHILGLARKWSENKERLRESLDIVHSWIHDMLVYPVCPDKIVHGDLTETIQCVSQKANTSRLWSTIRSVQALQRSIHTSANHRLAMEALLLEISSAQQAIGRTGNLHEKDRRHTV